MERPSGSGFLTREAESNQRFRRPTAARGRRADAKRLGLLLGAVAFLSVLLLFPVLLDPSDSPALAQEPEPASPVEADSGSSVPTFPADLKAPILMYHDVGPSANGLTVTPKMLAEQMDTLKSAGYRTVSLDTLLLAMRGEPVSLPEKPVVPTFDDAYTSVYTDAYPILKERGFSATLFVVTGLVGKQGYVTWEQINDLVGAGWTVGCHTARHLDLRTLSAEGLDAEIAVARKVLQEKTGQSVLSFCYPSGKYSDEVVEAVKAAGYYGAVTTSPGVVSLSDPQFTLKRVRIDGRAGLATFKAQLTIP